MKSCRKFKGRLEPNLECSSRSRLLAVVVLATSTLESSQDKATTLVE